MEKKRGNWQRRLILGGLGASVVSEWLKPIVNSILLPSHAASSLDQNRLSLPGFQFNCVTSGLIENRTYQIDDSGNFPRIIEVPFDFTNNVFEIIVDFSSVNVGVTTTIPTGLRVRNEHFIFNCDIGAVYRGNNGIFRSEILASPSQDRWEVIYTVTGNINDGINISSFELTKL